MSIQVIFFLFLYKNICCGYSLKVPHRGISNEYPQPGLWKFWNLNRSSRWRWRHQWAHFQKKKICIYHLSRKLMTIGSPISPFEYYTSTPLYDGSPGITSMIKAGVINKYSQVCKKKEKKNGFVLFPPPQGFPKLFINNWFPSCISAKTAGNRRDGTKRLSWT